MLRFSLAQQIELENLRILIYYTIFFSIKIAHTSFLPRGEPDWNEVELFWNSFDNAPSSIVFYLEMKVEVEVGVHNIRSRFTPRFLLRKHEIWLSLSKTLATYSPYWMCPRHCHTIYFFLEFCFFGCNRLCIVNGFL